MYSIAKEIRLMKTRTLSILTLSGIALAALNIFSGSNNLYVGVLACGLFFIPLSRHLGNVLFPEESRYVRLIWGILVLIAGLSIMTTAVYYLYAITTVTIFIPLALSLLVFFKKSPKPEQKGEELKESTFRVKPLLLLVLSLMIEGFLFKTLILNGTTDLLVSPWQTLEAWFFIVYALATIMVIYTSSQTHSALARYSLISLHLFLGFSIAAIIYIYGFGFDGFIHRATEMWIKERGFILPKTPYYIGQYSFIVFLSHLSAVPIFFLDIFYLPLSAALTLPVVFATVVKKNFQIPEQVAVHMVWLIPFLYLLSLNLTTPHNIVLLFMVILMLCIFGYLHTHFPVFVIITIAFAAALTHPLLGIPLVLFTIAAIGIKQSRKKTGGIWLILCIAGITLTPILLFGLNNLFQGHGFATMQNPLEHTGAFIELLKRPYWYAKNSTLLLEVVYAWQWTIPVMAMVVGLVGFRMWGKKTTASSLFLGGWISFILAAWLLRTTITFPGVSVAEQGNYPYRLLATSILFLLPSMIGGVVTIWQKIEPKKSWLKFGALACVGLALMFSLYFSYPQRNQKARFPGFNVTKTDFQTVQTIHNDNPRYDYVVLSNILTGAAALTEYGFVQYFPTNQGELFYYSVPSGGPLAHLYGRMLYEGQKQEYMLQAMDLVNVNKAYFVINSYWANFDTITEGAKKTADSWQSIDGGKAMVFTYHR